MYPPQETHSKKQKGRKRQVQFEDLVMAAKNKGNTKESNNFSKEKDQTASKRKPRASSPKIGKSKHEVSHVDVQDPPPHKKKKNNIATPIPIQSDLENCLNNDQALEKCNKKKLKRRAKDGVTQNAVKKASPNSPPKQSVPCPPSILKNKPSKSPEPSKESIDKYPILKNEELINRFMGVTVTNNQKGRIRQVLKELLRGTPEANLPDVIHGKIQSILLNTPSLTETDLRKIRILYNMLNTAIAAERDGVIQTKDSAKKKKKVDKTDSKENEKEKDGAMPRKESPKKRDSKGDIKQSGGKEKRDVGGSENDAVGKGGKEKVKGPKRYVVFVGNLPKDVSKEQLTSHFADLSGDIVDVRIPPPKPDKNSAIGYVELNNETSFEMALSKHHSMFCNRRINVLYTTQQNTKITRAEAKAKASKLVAMVKSGQLVGSVPLKKKRSQRRARQRAALKALKGDDA